MDDNERSTTAPRSSVCPECGFRADDETVLREHVRGRHDDIARDSDDAGGVVPEDQQAENGAGRVQTE